MINEFEAPIEDTYDDEVIALAEYLDTDIDNITKSDYWNNGVYDTDEGEYMILDDEDANNLAGDNIVESLWAFNADFICQHTALPCDGAELIQAFQEEKHEGANAVIYGLIEDIPEFIDDAITTDGRGHFLNTYDGEETEFGEWFIYRMY